MRRVHWNSLAALVAASLALSAAPPALRAQVPAVTIFEGARLLTGDGGVIEDSAFIVANDRFVGVGRRGELPPPPGAVRVDLAGKTVMPALVDDHVHMGYRTGTQLLRRQLHPREPARRCSTASPSSASPRSSRPAPARGDLPYRVRGEARIGRALSHRRPRLRHARCRPGRRDGGRAYGVTTEEEARADVRELAAHKPTWSRSGSTTATARWRSSRPSSTARSSTRRTGTICG